MAALQDDATIDETIAGSAWRRDGDAIVLEATFADFDEAWEFAEGVAGLARSADHHPDILVHGWNRSTITLSTHSAGGVTDLDLEMAASINSLLD
jgi:4a-hydroxytetrahydrobiopterin dehydratase